MENFWVRQKVSGMDPKTLFIFFRTRRRVRCAMWRILFPWKKPDPESMIPKAAWKIPDPSESLGSGSTNTVDIFRTRRRVRCAMWRILSSAYLEKPFGKTGWIRIHKQCFYFFRTRRGVSCAKWRIIFPT
jgi:hypothetical protein